MSDMDVTSFRFITLRRQAFRIFCILAFTSPAHAGEVALQINGLSYHPHTSVKYNDKNDGLGLQYSKFASDGGSYQFLAAGWLKNSVGHPLPYAGAGLAKRFGGEHLYTDLSLFIFGGSYHGYQRTIHFIAPLPVLSIGSGPVAVNFMYVPKIADVRDPAYFVQLKIILGNLGQRTAW